AQGADDRRTRAADFQRGQDARVLLVQRRRRELQLRKERSREGARREDRRRRAVRRSREAVAGSGAATLTGSPYFSESTKYKATGATTSSASIATATGRRIGDASTDVCCDAALGNTAAKRPCTVGHANHPATPASDSASPTATA